MISKLQKFFKKVEEAMFGPEEIDSAKLDTQRHNPEGPRPSREHLNMRYTLDPELEMQPRKIRFKNWGWFALFGLWYAGVIAFISYRLRSDDLLKLEIEAKHRMRINTEISQISKEQDFYLGDGLIVVP